MTAEVSAIVERARLAAQSAPAGETPGSDREKLKRIAQEFESMLLVQVLKDMRRAGSWEEEGATDGDTLGAEPLFETLDVELASHLARVKGLGLGRQLEEAFDRMTGGGTGVPGVPVVPGVPKVPGIPQVPQVLQVPQAPRVQDVLKATEPHHDVVSIVKKAAIATASAPKAIATLVKPVGGAITSAFGWRRHPITNEVKFHQGVDLRAAYGQEVQSAAAGRVVFSGDQGGYGATVLVEHEDGTRTRYAHLSARLVTQGDRVGAGEPLGRAGHSGHATGTHLHFEVIAPDGRRLPPDAYVASGFSRTDAVRLKADTTYGGSGIGNPAAVTATRTN